MSPVQPILNGTQLYDNKSGTEGWEVKRGKNKQKSPEFKAENFNSDYFFLLLLRN